MNLENFQKPDESSVPVGQESNNNLGSTKPSEPLGLKPNINNKGPESAAAAKPLVIKNDRKIIPKAEVKVPISKQEIQEPNGIRY